MVLKIVLKQLGIMKSGTPVLVPKTKAMLIILTLLTTLNFFWWQRQYLRDPGTHLHATYLNHLRNNRNLKDYIEGIDILLEPSKPPCDDGNILILVTVASAAFNVDRRNAIRTTWASYLPTLFIIGIHSPYEMQNVSDSFNDDLIVYKFQDHYQNLTLKTALMLKWAADKCSSKIQFLLKTDDDVLINPWQMLKIVQEKTQADLIGYKNKNAALYRNQGHKWYIPRWLYADDVVPEYLSGNAYLINEKYIRAILEAAFEVPVVNIEDLYFTFLVAKKKLGLNLTHEPRLRGFKPWLPFAILYWNEASVHDMPPKEMLKWWSRLVAIADTTDGYLLCVQLRNINVC